MLSPEQEVGLRLSLDPQYQNISSQELYNLAQNTLAVLTEEQAEGFFSKIADIGKKALPGVIQGAVAGSALGPWGALAGGIVGGASSALAKKQPSPMPSVPATVGSLPQGANAPAAAQLLQVLQNPLLSQSLLPLILGPAGRKTIPVSGKPVATGDFLNLLGTLAASASKEAAEVYGESHSETSDPNTEGLDSNNDNPEQRAKVLMELLQKEEDESISAAYPQQESIYNLLAKGGTLTLYLE